MPDIVAERLVHFGSAPRPSAAAAPRHDGFLVLTVAFICALSAAPMSMVFPVRPSVSTVTDFFPASVPGLNTDLGVSVLSRVEPEYQGGGMRAGGFIVRPQEDESISYDSNVLGYRGSPSSWIVHTAPSVAINSDWGRNKLGAYLSVDNGTYLDTPKQSRTDWTAAIGGTYTLGESEASVAYSHLTLHDDATNIGALPTSTPVPFEIDDLRAEYALPIGRFTLTPNVDYSMWRFGTSTILNQPSNQSFRDRDVIQAGMAVKYDLGGASDLLLTGAAINSNYIHTPAGLPGQSSQSEVVMAGLDYQLSGALRFQVLAGLEARQFHSAAYASRATPVGHATAIWTPTQLTTVTGTVARSIEDPSFEDTGGIIYSRASVEVDHELRRNIILRGSVGAQAAEYIQFHTTQTGINAGLGITWLINRNMRLTADYRFDTESGFAFQSVPGLGSLTGLATGSYNRHVVVLALHIEP